MDDVSAALRGAGQTVHQFFTVAERRFRAPEFQRHYVWRVDGQKAQIPAFWDDFEEMREEKSGEASTDSSFFIGAVVLQVIDDGGPAGVPVLSIIDGQQRILTLYMVLVALAEAFDSVGKPDLSHDIERRYLLNQDSAIRNTPRVDPTLNDTRQFQNMLSCLKNPVPSFSSPGIGVEDHNLSKAWRSIRDKVRELACDDSGDLSAEILSEIRDDLLTRVDIVAITLGSQHDPHEVYERLNTRGADLNAIDLIRNAVFLTVGSDQSAVERIYQHHWDPFESNLGLDHQDRFINPYVAIRDPAATNATLYPRLKQYWNKTMPVGTIGEEAAAWIVRDMEEYLPAYRALVGTAQPPKMEQQAWDEIQRLRRFAAPEMTYPYLMRLIYGYLDGEVTLEELRAVVDVLDSFFVRRAFAELRNSGIRQLFRRLWNSIGKSADGLLSQLGDGDVKFPNDEQFAELVRTTDLYHSSRCGYVLLEYERHSAQGDQLNWDALAENMQRDHLMPQQWSQDKWGHIAPDDHERLLHTFANLVPLKELNSWKQDRSWDEVREAMKEERQTYFISTRNVVEGNPVWDVAAIEARSEKLVEWALKRWPGSKL